MAKYCDKCGKALPEGVEICPDCNREAAETEAALFTRITAETEVWKDEKVKPERPKRTRSQKEKIGAALAAVLVLAFLVFAIAFTRPAPRVARAVRQGDYDRAVEIYWSSEKLTTGERVAAIDKAMLKEAEELCSLFAAQQIEADAAAAGLSKLGTLGDGAEALLADHYAEFRSLCSSRDRMADAEKHFMNDEYLDARADYLQVVEEDCLYAEARKKAEQCLTSYADQVLEKVDALLETDDYPAAFAELKTGNLTLEEYGTFSPAIDEKQAKCMADYEQHLLAGAQNLSELGDNAAAVELLRGGIEDYEMTSDAMLGAMETYQKLSRADVIRDARARADEQYEAGEYAAAFDELDALPDTLEGDTADIDAEIEDLEAQFAADRIMAAEKTFGGERKMLAEALALLDEAIEIRPLEDITAYREEIGQYLPLNLESADTLEKEGIVFRSTGVFESVDGVNYDQGWIWGEDGSSVSFKLDGAYDKFLADFCVRRADNKNANGHFELYCDGEKIYKSATLYHWQTNPIYVSVDISGCDVLKIVFSNDYKVSTTEDGYCYHGLCTAVVQKNMPEVPEAPATEE